MLRLNNNKKELFYYEYILFNYFLQKRFYSIVNIISVSKVGLEFFKFWRMSIVSEKKLNCKKNIKDN